MSKLKLEIKIENEKIEIYFFNKELNHEYDSKFFSLNDSIRYKEIIRSLTMETIEQNNGLLIENFLDSATYFIFFKRKINKHLINKVLEYSNILKDFN